MKSDCLHLLPHAMAQCVGAVTWLRAQCVYWQHGLCLSRPVFVASGNLQVDEDKAVI